MRHKPGNEKGSGIRSDFAVVDIALRDQADRSCRNCRLLRRARRLVIIKEFTTDLHALDSFQLFQATLYRRCLHRFIQSKFVGDGTSKSFFECLLGRALLDMLDRLITKI